MTKTAKLGLQSYLRSRLIDPTAMSPEEIYDRRFFEQHLSGSLRSARSLLPEIRTLVGGDSLVDIGCGVGAWLRAAQESGIRRVVGLDGRNVDSAQLLVGENDIRPCDLETEDIVEALRGMEPFDLVVCLEVAEHLTESRAASFVVELCQLSDVIVFSAAVPGQGGTGHVNEQWPNYWVDVFSRHSFACFDLRERFWDRQECEWWYLQNLLIFARHGSSGHARLSRTTAPAAAPMPLVHPRCLEQKQSEFAAHIGELNQLLIYQPFGRDEAIRMLERRVDDLRTIATERAREIEAARTKADDAKRRLDALTEQNARLLREMDAVRNSASWQVTRPLRMLKAAIGPARRR